MCGLYVDFDDAGLIYYAYKLNDINQAHPLVVQKLLLGMERQFWGRPCTSWPVIYSMEF